MFRAAAIVFVVLAMAAFAQVTSEVAEFRARQFGTGLPVPPAQNNWLTAPPIVIDCLITQRVAITVVETVVSQECLRVVFHKQGQWRTNDVRMGEPAIVSVVTNIFSLSNAPAQK